MFRAPGRTKRAGGDGVWSRGPELRLVRREMELNSVVVVGFRGGNGGAVDEFHQLSSGLWQRPEAAQACLGRTVEAHLTLPCLGLHPGQREDNAPWQSGSPIERPWRAGQPIGPSAREWEACCEPNTTTLNDCSTMLKPGADGEWMTIACRPVQISTSSNLPITAANNIQ